MAVKLPNGSRLELASQYGAAKPITALSNAAEAEATSAAHGFAAGAILAITSGWSRLTDRIVRVGAAPAAGTFKLEGINSSNVDMYPVGQGAGEATPITGWTAISQVLEFSMSGGDAQFANYQFLEDDDEKQIPSGNAAASISIKIADDPNLPCYPVLRAAADSAEPTALALVMRGGSRLYYNCYVSFNETPELSKGNVNAVKASFSLLAKPVRYNS